MEVTWEASLSGAAGPLVLDVELAGGLTPLALIGPNAAGKTTVLQTIAGARTPDSGRIVVGGHTLFDSEASVDLAPEARRVGYVPQGYGLFPHLSVIENVGFGVRNDGERRSTAQRKAKAHDMLEWMDCAHLADRTIHDLSGGESQRVALARALMIEPRILLLDEPLSALDAAARRSMRRYLADYLADAQVPAIVVTHDARDVAALQADVAVLEDGRIVQRGPPAEAAAAPKTEFVAEFFEAMRI